MITLINIELYKIFKKWRTYIGFIAIGVLTPIVQIALYYEGLEGFVNFATRNIQESFFMTGNFLNGYLLANIFLQTLFVHIPFLIVLVGGDLIAGESTAGTFRVLVTRPVSRFSIITSKFIAGLIYTFLLVAWLALLSLGLSVLIFGTGELITVKDKIYIFASNDVLWRFLLAYFYAFLSMSTVFALSFLFSSLVENAIGPIIGAMSVLIIFYVLMALPINALQPISKFLFTNYMSKWNEFMRNPVDYATVINSASILVAHITGFYFITFYFFKRKDILS